MPHYTVNATVTMAGYTTVEADDEDEALELARQVRPSDFDTDPFTAEVDFNVDPAVEAA